MAVIEVCRTYTGKSNHFRIDGMIQSLCLNSAWPGIINGEDDGGNLCIYCYRKITLRFRDRVNEMSTPALLLWISEALRLGDTNPFEVTRLLQERVWLDGAHWRTYLRTSVAKETESL